MRRSRLICLLAAVTLFASGTACAAPPDTPGSDTPPLTYDLMINGETFSVEANRQAKLKSQSKPGVTYDVAIQIAMEQHIRLDRLRFSYDWPATVQESRRRGQRTVRIRHELGFTVIVTDLGPAMDAKSQEEVLKIMTESMAESLRESGVKKLETAPPREWKFAHSSGRGVQFRYEDQQGTPQTSLALVLGAPNFAASCIVQYFDANAENALPRVRKIVDSIRGLNTP